MTVVFIDPIHGAALTAGLLPILPGLPARHAGAAVDLSAPTSGKGGVRAPTATALGVDAAGQPRTHRRHQRRAGQSGRLGPQGPYVNWRDRRRNQGWGWVLDTKGGAATRSSCRR